MQVQCIIGSGGSHLLLIGYIKLLLRGFGGGGGGRRTKCMHLLPGIQKYVQAVVQFPLDMYMYMHVNVAIYIVAIIQSKLMS